MVVTRKAGRRETTPVVNLPVDHSRDIISIPNVITVLRFALIPVVYWFLVYAGPPSGPNHIAFVLFAICAGTDWLDGLIARATGHVTAIGKIIDPLVDRVLIAAALVGLYMVNRVSLLLMLTLVGRDVYLLYGAWVLERHGKRIPVTIFGKVTTAVLMAGFGSIVWNFPILQAPTLFTYEVLGSPHVVGGTRPLGSYIVYVGVVLSLTSAAQYTVRGRAAYRDALAEAESAAAGEQRV